MAGLPPVPGLAPNPAPPPAQEFLLLPDPVDAVLNHVGLEADLALEQPRPQQSKQEVEQRVRNPASLEDACVMAYLKYLETEIVTYISLTQSKSLLVKGVAKRMLQVSNIVELGNGNSVTFISFFRIFWKK